MSNTELGNAVRVYEAIQRVALAKIGLWHRIFTVGEVAKAAGMSKPTCQKYIEFMITENLVECQNPHYMKRERQVRQYKYIEEVR